jgi:hypothetical protein
MYIECIYYTYFMYYFKFLIVLFDDFVELSSRLLGLLICFELHNMSLFKPLFY